MGIIEKVALGLLEGSYVMIYIYGFLVHFPFSSEAIFEVSMSKRQLISNILLPHIQWISAQDHVCPQCSGMNVVLKSCT